MISFQKSPYSFTNLRNCCILLHIFYSAPICFAAVLFYPPSAALQSGADNCHENPEQSLYSWPKIPIFLYHQLRIDFIPHFIIFIAYHIDSLLHKFLNIPVQTKDGKNFYMGDSINNPLLSDQNSIWNLAAGICQKLEPSRPLPNIKELVKQTVDMIGNENYKMWNEIPSGSVNAFMSIFQMSSAPVFAPISGSCSRASPSCL